MSFDIQVPVNFEKAVRSIKMMHKNAIDASRGSHFASVLLGRNFFKMMSFSRILVKNQEVMLKSSRDHSESSVDAIRVLQAETWLTIYRLV